MKHAKHGQVSTEIIILLVVIMGLFLILLTVSEKRDDQLAGIKKYLSAKDIADDVAWNINSALISGFGARRSFAIPAKLSDGTAFNVTVDGPSRSVLVEWGSRMYVAPLLTSNMTGNTTLAQGLVNVTNILGVIKVEE